MKISLFRKYIDELIYLVKQEEGENISSEYNEDNEDEFFENNEELDLENDISKIKINEKKENNNEL